MRRCGNEKMWIYKMTRCKDVKMFEDVFNRPPLLEEPFAQTLSGKKHGFEPFFKGIWKGKSTAPKLGKPADKSFSQPWCSHSTAICYVQLQKTINSTTHTAAAPSNFEACRARVAKHNRITCSSFRNCSSKTGSRYQSKKRKGFEALFKGILNGKSPPPKWENLLTNHSRNLDAATPLRFLMSSSKRQ